MNSELLTKIELNRRETLVLDHMIKGLTSKQISHRTKIAYNHVRSARQMLLQKFQAKSTIHLIVIASTEYSNFLKLQVRTYRHNSEIDGIMTSVVLRTLQGFQTKEISSQLNLKIGEVLYLKSKFASIVGVTNYADFVRRSFEYGLLVTTPFLFGRSYKNEHGIKKRKISFEESNFPKCFDYNQLNKSGFLYLDFQNRFIYEFSSSLDTTDSIRLLVKLMHTSDVPRKAVSEFVGLTLINWDDAQNNHYWENALARLDSFKNLVNSPQFRWNIQPFQVTPIQIVGLKIFIKSLLQKKTENEALSDLNIKKFDLRGYFKLAFEVWHCNSLIGLVATFVHMNFLEQKKLI